MLKVRRKSELLARRDKKPRVKLLNLSQSNSSSLLRHYRRTKAEQEACTPYKPGHCASSRAGKKGTSRVRNSYSPSDSELRSTTHFPTVRFVLQVSSYLHLPVFLLILQPVCKHLLLLSHPGSHRDPLYVVDYLVKTIYLVGQIVLEFILLFVIQVHVVSQLLDEGLHVHIILQVPVDPVLYGKLLGYRNVKLHQPCLHSPPIDTSPRSTCGSSAEDGRLASFSPALVTNGAEISHPSSSPSLSCLLEPLAIILINYPAERLQLHYKRTLSLLFGNPLPSNDCSCSVLSSLASVCCT